MKGIGLMCGTSHDALDIAFVKFSRTEKNWSFKLIQSQSIDIEDGIKSRLSKSTQMNGLDLLLLDRDFAKFCAVSVNEFKRKFQIEPEFIASHGVTIFHQPQNGVTLQIGSGAILSAITNNVVISDFRMQDVAKNGQGAPLVPYADRHLFPESYFTVNLGGFANLSVNDSGTKALGFDICPCNLILNHYSHQLGFAYDKGGEIGKSGNINAELLSNLNKLSFYSESSPKSLGYEWFVSNYLPLFPSHISPKDGLATAIEHIAIQIGSVLNKPEKCLVTGGGAHNHFLLERIQYHSQSTLDIPDRNLIEFKEAICFAFLGLLRLNAEFNIDSNVTGSDSNTCAGAVYLP
jgi:anhydro-N-acetylmuramic acid kinase